MSPATTMKTTALNTSTILARSASLSAGVETGAKMLEMVSAVCRGMLSTTGLPLGTQLAHPRASAFSIGNWRIRLPVAANTAFASAGATVAVPGSPIPPGFSKFRTR